MEQVFLNVSEMHTTSDIKKIKTVLGSCLAIIIYVPRLKISAICHARLPSGTCSPSHKNGFCYVDSSIDFMVNTLLKQGGNIHEMVVKAFGGAQVAFKNIEKKLINNSIGEQNIAALQTALLKYNLPLCSYEMGGSLGMKLIYYTERNEVLIKKLSPIVFTEHDINLLMQSFVLKE